MLNCVDVAVLKNNSLVYYKDFGRRKYNEKSKGNLRQYKESSPVLKSLQKQTTINDITAYTETYKKVYEAETGKAYRTALSGATANKIEKITSVFVNAIIKSYRQTDGFQGRIISFSTFTLSGVQNHTDKVIIKTFVEFIKHLRKVDNYIICPYTKKETKEKAPRLGNYVWRAETQENGNIHFHLIADVFLNKNMLKRLWNNYLEKLGYPRAYNSCRVESLKKDKRNNKILDVTKYLCKYMTKLPLKKAFGNISRRQAEDLKQAGINPYRREIIGKQWGCSKALLKTDFPKFYDYQLSELQELKSQLKEIVCDKIPDFIKVFRGNIKQKLKKCSYGLQRFVKEHYQKTAEFISGAFSRRICLSDYIRLRSFEKENRIAIIGNDDDIHEAVEELKKSQWNYEIYRRLFAG